MPLRVRCSGLKKGRNFIVQAKKRHTLKTQAVVNAKTLEILALNFAKGRRHDFRIFKESRLKIAEKIVIRADSGYPGIDKIHKNRSLSKKSSKKIRFPGKISRTTKSCHVRGFLQNTLSAKLKFLKYFQINTETEEKDLS